MDFNVVKHMVEEFFNGQYEVEKFLGAGAFADVYLVKHMFLDDLRAIKIIKKPLKSTKDKTEIFHEVRLATQLRHENVISIYDAGIIPTYGLKNDGFFNLNNKNQAKRDDWAFFVMEYVQGGDLEEYMSSYADIGLSMPVNKVLEIIKQILLGLNNLHSAKPAIVHRDLKPNNILLSHNSQGNLVIKISDFGFAKEVTENSLDIEIAGSKFYLAPECFNKISSAMSDTYAVGVILYQLLTNRYPYDIDQFELYEIFESLPWKSNLKPPSEYRSEIPQGLDEILLKALDADPKNRYADAMEFLTSINKLIDELGIGYNEKSNFTPIDEDYSEYVINDSIKEAFKLAKCQKGLPKAIEILESQVLQDYEIRKCYIDTLRMWKSKRPDVKLISKAFSVNLRGKNYKLSCNLLKEAIACNPDIENKYQPYIELWTIFQNLGNHGVLVNAVLDLKDLMDKSKIIHDEYINVINILSTYSSEEIFAESIRLENSNELVDASKLLEFLVVSDENIRKNYDYKLSLLKQNMEIDFKSNQKPKKDAVNFAIDLGTADSIISYYNNGNPIIIPNHSTGLDYTPSAVYIGDNEEICVGQKARDALIENSKNAVSEFKKDMGFQFPFVFKKSSHMMLPEELSAEVLKDLRKSVYNHCGVNFEDVVVCVPANSNPMKTRAVNDAVELAGFRSHNLILEPIAVAIAYRQIIPDEGIWMIYDLGGATFNVTLVNLSNQNIEKIATSGFDNIGGNLFNLKIVEEALVPKIINEFNLQDFTKDNSKYDDEFAKLIVACEHAKMELSDVESTEIILEKFMFGRDFRYTLTRDELKEILSSLIKPTLDLCNELIDENSIDKHDIDRIILVGGSCLSPIVKQLIKEEFEIPIENSIDPLTVVSKGAAIYAGGLNKPSHNVIESKHSIILNKQKYGVTGRAFNLDEKFSYLGFTIEFETEDFSYGRIPLEVDGSFKVNLDINEDYKISLFDNGGQLVEIDEKSPVSIKNKKFYIEFLDDYYDISIHDVAYEGIAQGCDEVIGFSNEFEDFNQQDILQYLERLIDISKNDNRAINLVTVYLDYLTNIIEDIQNRLKFDLLLENVESKIDVLQHCMYDNAAGKLDEFESLVYDLKNVNQNFRELKRIYLRLIELYVSINREDVIKSCFYNLRYNGLFTYNQNHADDLIEKAQYSIMNSDYEELLDIVNELYVLDEREI